MARLSDKTRLFLKLFTPQPKEPNPLFALTKEEQNLNGKIIAITGATDGIGAAAANMLCQMGAHIIILARNKSKGNSTVKKLNEIREGAATLIMCDLSSMDSVRHCAEEILQRFTKINVMVNCAGVNQLGKLKLTVDKIENTWAINYFAPVLLTRLLLPIITERIVNLTTDTLYIDNIDFDYISTHNDFNTASPYAESKLALNCFTIDLAHELKSRGVSVNALLPGYIKSNLLRELKGATKIMQGVMNLFASPTEVGADRVVRMVAASRFKTESGLYVNEDKIEPYHPAALERDNRRKIASVTSHFLEKWL